LILDQGEYGLCQYLHDTLENQVDVT